MGLQTVRHDWATKHARYELLLFSPVVFHLFPKLSTIAMHSSYNKRNIYLILKARWVLVVWEDSSMVLSYRDNELTNNYWSLIIYSFPGGASGKEPACQCRRRKRLGLIPGLGRFPWRRKWQPTLVLLPGKSHGQRSLVSWGCERFGDETTTCPSSTQ